MLQLIIVIIVAVVAFGYVRAMRRSRQAWLTKLDLPGTWRWEAGDAVLVLSGGLDRGSFVRREGRRDSSGEWRLSGHELVLQRGGQEDRFALYFFKPGHIGLADERGDQRSYLKQAGNVVPLRRT